MNVSALPEAVVNRIVSGFVYGHKYTHLYPLLCAAGIHRKAGTYCYACHKEVSP